MYAAWHLPHFPLQALHLPPQQAIALLDPLAPTHQPDARLILVSHAAQQLGIHPGTTVSQALARCPELHLLYRDETAEHTLQTTLLTCAETFTPDYESTQPGLILLDLRHLPHSTSWQDLAWQMHHLLSSHQLVSHIGLAENPDLATLAAHLATPILLLPSDPTAQRHLLGQLHLTALQPTPHLLQLLHLWGLTTLAQFTAIPRTDIARRLGTEGLRLWDLAHGGSQRLLKLVRPKTTFQEEVELHENPIETLPPLIHHLDLLLARLSHQLATAWLLASSLHLTLQFADRTAHQRTLHIAEPTRDSPTLLRLLHSHLETLSAPAPIIHLSLSLTPTRPTASQATLFDTALRDPNRFAETLSALTALLGPNRLGRPCPQPSHRPDSFQLTPFLEKSHLTLPTSPHAHRPLQRYRPPKPAQVRTHQNRPVQLHFDHHNHHLISTHGPWHLSGHWWDTQHTWSCQIWHTLTTQGTRYQLHLTPPQQWHVIGIQA
jgi:protein ImuB